MAAPTQPFDRVTIERAFERLGELAVAAGKIVEISVYGRSALVRYRRRPGSASKRCLERDWL
jgi:hypothetical protein